MPQFDAAFIAQQRELASKATPRPWEYDDQGFVWIPDKQVIAQTFDRQDKDFENYENDGPYIAAACNGYAAALEEIVRLRKFLVRLNAWCGKNPDRDLHFEPPWYAELHELLEAINVT